MRPLSLAFTLALALQGCGRPDGFVPPPLTPTERTLRRIDALRHEVQSPRNYDHHSLALAALATYPDSSLWDFWVNLAHQAELNNYDRTEILRGLKATGGEAKYVVFVKGLQSDKGWWDYLIGRCTLDPGDLPKIEATKLLEAARTDDSWGVLGCYLKGFTGAELLKHRDELLATGKSQAVGAALSYAPPPSLDLLNRLKERPDVAGNAASNLYFDERRKAGPFTDAELLAWCHSKNERVREVAYHALHKLSNEPDQAKRLDRLLVALTDDSVLDQLPFYVKGLVEQRGQAFERQGDITKAMEVYRLFLRAARRAPKTDPLGGETCAALYFLGLLDHALGDDTEAREIAKLLEAASALSANTQGTDFPETNCKIASERLKTLIDGPLRANVTVTKDHKRLEFVIINDGPKPVTLLVGRATWAPDALAPLDMTIEVNGTRVGFFRAEAIYGREMVLGPGERWAFVQPFEMKARAGRVWVEIQTQSGTNPEPLRAITVVR